MRSIACCRLTCLGLLLIATCLAAGCDVQLYRAEDTTSEVFSTGAKPKVIVASFNGSIDISTGSENEVVVEVTRHAGGYNEDAARDNLERVDLSISQIDNEVLVRAERSGHPFGDCGASMIIVVPPEAVVELETSNGYIVCEGLRGPVRAVTSNAKIEAVEATDNLVLRTSNGSILVEASDAKVDAKTSNASIKFRGTLVSDDNLLKTSNGSIDVRLPADSQFEVEASTSNASIDSEFKSNDSGEGKRRRSRRLETTIGEDPTFSLELATSNGSIKLRKLAPKE